MKIKTLGALAVSGMLTVGSVVYAVTPAGGFGRSVDSGARASSAASGSAEVEAGGKTDAQNPVTVRSEFSVGTTLKVEGRVAQPAMLANSAQDTFVLLELSGNEQATGKAPRVDLSLVIDKSGSMAGSKMKNALAAAVTAVQRLKEGDTVSVIAFDTKTEVVVPPTVLSSTSRGDVMEKIRGIRLGGDTCISCGLEESISQLSRAGGTGGVKRMLLLSDGAPTAGVRDESGFTEIAARAMKGGVNITTVGVDIEFNERVMTSIAAASNGGHYFVENEAALTKVFDAEAAALEQTVADTAVATFDLPNGVELVQVADRTFDRSGSRISVPLGGFTKGMRKTVLLKVRAGAREPGTFKLADVRVSYRDVLTDRAVDENGTLEIELVKDRSNVSEMDGVVLDRVQRSETAAALDDANALFRSGRVDEARRRLEDAKRKVQEQKTKAAKSAPQRRAGDVNDSFDKQEKSLDRASGGFAPPPAPKATGTAMPAEAPRPSPKPASVSRQNAEDSFNQTR